MQASKKNVYVLTDSVKAAAGSKNVYLAKTLNSVPLDSLRDALGRYWRGTIDKLEYGNEQKEEAFLNDTHLEIHFGEAKTRRSKKSPYVLKEQRICFKGDGQVWGKNGYTYARWKQLLRRVVPAPHETYRDVCFKIDTPLNQRERKRLGNASGVGFIDVEFTYNYYNKKYEDAMSRVREEMLPNIYAFITDNVSRNMYNLKTIQGFIATSKRQARNFAKNSSSYGAYLTTLSRLYRRLKAEFIDQFSNLFSNFIVPFENLDLISDPDIVNSFPMFVKLNFSTDSVTEVAQALEDASLSTSLQRHAAAAIGGNNESLFNIMGGELLNFFVAKQNNILSTNIRSKLNTSIGNYKSLDITTWWERYLSNKIPKIYKNQTFVGPKTYSVYISSGAVQNNLAKALSLIIFQEKIRQIAANHNRSIEEIMAGELCHSETVIYRVAKYVGDPENNQPIQSYWFPNSNNIDVIKLIDTQIKYDKAYTYRVYAYQLVIGSEYFYRPVELNPTDPPEGECPDGPQVDLNGPVLDDDGLMDLSLVQQDIRTVLDILRINPANSSDVTYLALYIASVFAYSGNLRHLAYFPYYNLICKAVARAYGIPKATLMAAFNQIIVSVKAGEAIPLPGIDVPPPAEDYVSCVDVVSYPRIELVEVPFFTHTLFTVDSPPLPPDVNIVPYRGENNKALILLNSTIGEQTTYPIPIYPADVRQFQKIRQQNFLDAGDPITFRSDDPAMNFEVFRMDEKPERYRDFSQNQRILLDTVIDPVSGQRAGSASFVDDIQPNRKYYYMFRARDVHTNVSNPTKIFEVELVDNDGAVYMIVNIVDPELRQKPFEPVIESRKYAHIVPRLTQAVFDPERNGLEDARSALQAVNYSLGAEDESIWGKKFKIRFISKSTGRKIDLNVNYKKRHQRTDEEVELRKDLKDELDRLGIDYADVFRGIIS